MEEKKIPIGPIPMRYQPDIDRHFNKIFGGYLRRKTSLLCEEPEVYGKANRKYIFGAFDRGKLVAQSAANPGVAVLEGVKVKWAAYGNVFTIPEYRGRRISSRLNAKLWEKLRRNGFEGVFISGGRSLYTRAGATGCGDYQSFIYAGNWLKRQLRTPGQLGVRACSWEDAKILVRLHAGENTGFRREPLAFQSVLKHGTGNLHRASAWLVTFCKTPVGYVVVGPGEKRTAIIMDYAGARSALVWALPLLLKRTRMKNVWILAGGWDAELLWLLRGLGKGGEWGGVDGTQLLLDPVRFVRRLKPYFQRRLGRSAGLRLTKKGKAGFEWRMGGKRFSQDLGGVTKLMLGDKPAKWGRLLPKNKALRETMRRVFPLPFPIIGLGWI